MYYALAIISLLQLTPFSADRVEIVKEDGVSIVYLLGNVIIEEEDTKIACLEARLNETAGNVLLIDSVRIKDKDGLITASTALYFFNSKKGYLAGDVVLATENEIISADSLSYDGIKRYVEMFKDVKIDDLKNRLTAYAGKGFYDLEKEEGNLTINPKLEIFREGKEPIRMSAKEFHIVTRENIFYGFDSVVGIIDSITLWCDTIAYDLATKTGKMVRPLIIEKSNELKGGLGTFALKDKNIEKFSVENGRAAYYTKEGSKNVVEGSTITILFKDGSASKVVVQGNPKGRLTLKKAKEDAGD